jgi:hypothetical protein
MNKQAGECRSPEPKSKLPEEFQTPQRLKEKGYLKKKKKTVYFFQPSLSCAYHWLLGIFVTRKFTFKYLLSGFKPQILQASILPHYRADV